MDAPDTGPLNDPASREGYLQEVELEKMGDLPLMPQHEFFESDHNWLGVLRVLDQGRYGRVIIWIMESGADYVFLRQCAFMLADMNLPVCRITVPVNPGDGVQALAYQSVERLVEFKDSEPCSPQKNVQGSQLSMEISVLIPSSYE